ncbi:MAG: chromosome partitioning protein ParB [Nitrospirae bacterium GWD2_57_9]|nr:MAG: chromosome partitioning protein ParB [Nitrospirae bacterium GWD2_57_9]OGW45360.1 MAG: chromosome partitioning protein ParB [Nitrospirae bacterium GWC2_57_9]
MQKQALGKGLGALIPDLSTLDDKERKALGISEIELDKIIPNEYQPRKSFDDEKLKELAASIKEQGVIQPIIVHRAGPGYQLIAGERRWRAARLAGLKTIPALVKEATKRELMEMALIENIQREDLNALEAAEAYKRLQDEFKLTQEDLAKRVGKERSTVTNFLRILSLPKEVKQELASGVLSMGHAKALLSLERVRDQLSAAAAIAKKGLSVREAEALAAKLKNPSREKRPRQSHELKSVEEKLRKALGTKVSIAAKAKGGRIVIDYYSNEELDRILDKIC